LADREHLLIGIHAVNAALKSAPADIRWLRLADTSRNKRLAEIGQRAASAGIGVTMTPVNELDRLAQGQKHQGVVAGFAGDNLVSEVRLPAVLDGLGDTALVLVLDGVQDPHNLGACLRTAEAAGVGLVILCKDRSAGITPVVRRAACGAAETLTIMQVTNLARVLRALKSHGIWLAGASGAATDTIYQADLRGPLALVMGSEGSGLRRLSRDLCDYLVRIPMAGQVESLNVSVATAVCLYEILRQRC